MKFLYEYRTSDNVKHSGVIKAADREAAYALLKKQGIKPSRFSEAPGFFNKLFGKGKRWIAIGVLGVLCLVLCAVVAFRIGGDNDVGLRDTLDATSRRQVIGDAEIVAQGIRTGWADVFAEEGERFLASFAIPGVPAGQRSTTEEEIAAALERSVEVAPSDPIETRQIKSMVEGMKQELREFLAAGGTIKQYGKRLVRRQEEEISYYTRAKAEMEQAIRMRQGEREIAALVSKHNASLRKLGIKPIILPD